MNVVFVQIDELTTCQIIKMQTGCWKAKYLKGEAVSSNLRLYFTLFSVRFRRNIKIR